jgi:SAM-dependent methyltransferase
MKLKDKRIGHGQNFLLGHGARTSREPSVEKTQNEEREGGTYLLHALRLCPAIRILEMECGHGAHMPYLVNHSQGIRYFGLGTSAHKVGRAQRENPDYLKERKALFQLYDGGKIPYVTQFFHRILTVDPQGLGQYPTNFLKDCYRVLVEEGVFVTALSLQGPNAALDWEDLCKRTGFLCLDRKVVEVGDPNEILGELSGQFLVVVLKKPLRPKIVKDEVVFRRRG